MVASNKNADDLQSQ